MKLLVEPNAKKIAKSLYDDHDAILPDFTIGEQVALSVGVLKRIRLPWNDRIFTPIDPTDWTIRASLGSFREAVGGTFEALFETEPSPILVPAAGTTAYDLERAYNEIEGIDDAGGLTVTGADGFFVFSFNEVGARSILMADATQAIPSLLLHFERLVIGDADNKAVQTLRIQQNIASLADLDQDSGSTEASFTVIAATDLFTSTAHGLTAGARIRFFGSLPSPLSDLIDYFVIPSGLTADDFKVSTTAGGAAVNVAVDGAGTFVLSGIETLVQGDGSHSQKVKLSLPEDRWGGTFTVIINSQTSDLLGSDDSAEMIQSVLESAQGVGAGNVSVSQDDDDDFIILFKGALANVAIAVAADLRELKVIQTKDGVLDLRNAQVDFLIDNPEGNIVSLELELSSPSGDLTKARFDVFLRPAIIEEDSVLAPFPASNYYTVEQIDAILAGIASDQRHRIDEYQATTNQTVYPLTETPTSTPIVFIRGLVQESADYSTLANVLTLDSGADIVADDQVLIFYFY